MCGRTALEWCSSAHAQWLARLQYCQQTWQRVSCTNDGTGSAADNVGLGMKRCTSCKCVTFTMLHASRLS